jgi:hypothetical protein
MLDHLKTFVPPVVRKFRFVEWLTSSEGPSAKSGLRSIRLPRSTRIALRLCHPLRPPTPDRVFIPSGQITKITALRRYARDYGLDLFAETGTCRGDTTAALARQFRQCITIELSPVLHAKAQARLSRFCNVTCVLGDSGDILGPLIHELSGPILFWLDAHSSGGETVDTGTGPVVNELRAIFSHSNGHRHVVLIDDARGHNLEAIRRTIPSSHRVAIRNDILRITPV